MNIVQLAESNVAIYLSMASHHLKKVGYPEAVLREAKKTIYLKLEKMSMKEVEEYIDSVEDAEYELERLLGDVTP